MSLQNPLARVRGLGSAKSGTHHFWVQRLTAVALVGLTPWFLWSVLCLLDADAATARGFVAQPLNASLLLAFLLALCWHARLGLQVVIEDYVHTRWLEMALQLAVLFAYTLAFVVSAVAVGRIVISA